mgnify:CR=1 FL=1
MSLKSNVESLLFGAGRPMTAKKVGEFVGEKEGPVEDVLKQLQQEYKGRESGLQIFSTGKNWQMGTSGESSSAVAAFVKEEFAGELTRPQLETLTVIAYRGPISKIELEIIRGVSCGLILRNLMIRGLVDEEYDPVRKENRIRVSMDFLRHLGVRAVEELPEYEALHSHEVMATLLEQQSGNS